MSDKTSSKAGVWLAVLVLIGAIGLLVSLVLDQKDYTAIAEARLKERTDQYMRLRMDDNWNEIYKMTDPDERKKVNRSEFLGFYGTGVLRTEHAEVRGVDFDPKRPEATTTIFMRNRLVPENLPPQARKMRVTDPSELLQETDLSLDWIWKTGHESRPEGEWFLRMEREVLRGRDAYGQNVTPIGQLPRGK